MKSSIHGNNIVWEDYRDDSFGTWASPGNRNSNIYLNNLETQQTYQITTNNSTQINPDIWGNYVVWEDYRNDGADIYYTDISPLFEDEELDIQRLTFDSEDQIKPKIHDGYVVWEDYTDNYYGDICIYNIIENLGPYRINTRNTDDSLVPHRNPDIFENKVVWTDYRNHWGDRLKGDIFIYDLSVDSNDDGIPNFRDSEITYDDPAEFELANQSIHQHSPSIYKDTIVWTEYNSTNNNDIYFKSMGGERTQISRDGMKDDNPTIYGEIVIYQKSEYEVVDGDRRNTGYSIWLYNLHDGEHELIRQIPADEDRRGRVKVRFPSIHQNRITWEENHPSSDEDIDYQYDIFYTETEAKEPIIESAEVANQTEEFSHSTEMYLVDGNKIHFRTEVIDPNGNVEQVTVDTSELTDSVDHIDLFESQQNIYKGSLDYQDDMQEGTYNVTIEVWDSSGNRIESDILEIRLFEVPLEFSFVGVGTDINELGNETNFVLEEGNSIFFTADLSEFEGEVSRVYVDVSSFELDRSEFDLSIHEGLYLYEYEFEEDISPGEKTVRFHAVSSRGQEIESRNLTVNVLAKPTQTPNIISSGVGRELSEVRQSIDFELEDGNYIYFIATVEHAEDVSYNVSLNIEGMENIEMIEKVDENTYYYRLEYSEGLEQGEKTADIFVEDEFCQNVTSEEIKINFIPPEESLPMYYYLIPVLAVILLIVGVLYWKKPEYFKKSY
ncbi:MAG: hypothetical protein ACQEQM_00010 [Thermoplasmatota archaeon]